MAVENEEDDVVVRMIHSASVLRSDTLDLSKKRIYEIPKEILNLKQLESLHLEGNFLTELPDEFFEKLTNLKWLDLRNNRLSSIPANVGRHRCLRSFLLEGNSLTHLPCELGMTKSLCGLHLFGNPLEFPPHYIVEKGTQEILRFLREMSEESPRDEKYGESVVSDEESEEMIINSDRKHRLFKPYTNTGDFPEPVNSPATFHHPPKRLDQLRYQYDKLRISSSETPRKLKALPPRRRASLDEQEITSKTGSKPRKAELTGGRGPLANYKPASDSALKKSKRDREKRLRRTASLNEEENVLRQKIKNKIAIDDWREESRIRQQRKHYEAIRKGVIKVKIPSPFATEDSEAAKKELKGTQKKVDEYNKRLHSLLEMNDKELTRKALNDRELENRIKKHIQKIREHRATNFENVSDEVEEAKSNLDLAQKLHEELGQRRAMEYRLRAFTGDDLVLNPRYYNNER